MASEQKIFSKFFEIYRSHRSHRSPIILYQDSIQQLPLVSIDCNVFYENNLIKKKIDSNQLINRIVLIEYF